MWILGKIKYNGFVVSRRKQKSLNNAGSWRSWRFWRNLLFYFLFFSYIGHFIEMAWAWIAHLVTGRELMTNILANPFEPYTIYGLGAVLCVVIGRPILRRFNHHIVATFLVTTLICAALEYVSSVILAWRYGSNPYWDYSDRPFNLGGHICLTNSLLFGLIATLFLKLIYPQTEKFLWRGNQILINSMLVVLIGLFIGYYACGAGVF